MVGLLDSFNDGVLSMAVAAMERPDFFTWKSHGLGMYRTYLYDKPTDEDVFYRLHVWMPTERVQDVSDIHTHPWDLAAKVLCGSIANERYRETGMNHYGRVFPAYRKAIHCGSLRPDNSPTEETWLEPKLTEFIYPGRSGSYFMGATRIHRTNAVPGTVTLCALRPRPDLHNTAFVYWPADQPGFVDARSRWVPSDEIRDVVQPLAYKVEV